MFRIFLAVATVEALSVFFTDSLTLQPFGFLVEGMEEKRDHGPAYWWTQNSHADNVWMVARAWLQHNDTKPDAERWRLCWRDDTRQVWEQDERRQALGLVIDDPDGVLGDAPPGPVGGAERPFAICLGGYVLERHKYLHRAVTQLCTRAGNTVAWAQWHVSVGFPCHPDCDC